MAKGPTLVQLRVFFGASSGSEAELSILQQFAEPERRLVLAAKGLDGYRGFRLPGDVGSRAIRGLDGVFRSALVDPKTDKVWLVRAAASLFGLILAARTSASWESPRGYPIFMAMPSLRRQPVLISPLRLTLDTIWHRGPAFTETYEALFRFWEDRGPLPHHLYRLDPSRDADPRVTWQWAWSLVATCGRFGGTGWDLDFSVASLARLGELLVRGEGGLADFAREGVASVDRDVARRHAWLAKASRAYLGETLKAQLAARWSLSGDTQAVARMVQIPGAPDLLDVAAWIAAAHRTRNERLLLELGGRLMAAVHAAGPWPTL